MGTTISELKDMYPDISMDIWHMFENLDAYTYNHSIRTCEMAQIVEQTLGYSNKHLSEAALFHDIGKYFISERVLNKHCNLTTFERFIIDTHAFLSYFTLKYFGVNKEICKITLYHHSLEPVILKKKIKSSKSDDIKRKALMLKTIDIFEAMTTDRPYRRGATTNTATKAFCNIDYDEETLNILTTCKELERE